MGIAQGKTRLKNPVYLSNCRSHQSYYTCLSRSATASGTVIVQLFCPRLITCGASGYFRQEFHEFELLDDITKLRYKGAGSKTAAEVETTNIQLGFVAAKGRVPVDSGGKNENSKKLKI